ncbi:hypothetical protein V6N13_051534 [Hibiscus sabdariffa]
MVDELVCWRLVAAMTTTLVSRMSITCFLESILLSGKDLGWARNQQLHFVDKLNFLLGVKRLQSTLEKSALYLEFDNKVLVNWLANPIQSPCGAARSLTDTLRSCSVYVSCYVQN